MVGKSRGLDFDDDDADDSRNEKTNVNRQEQPTGLQGLMGDLTANIDIED